MNQIDFVASSLGGALIGASAGALWLLHGRIAGISGITGSFLTGVLDNSSPDLLWRGSFLSGIALGGVAMHSVFHQAFSPPTEIASGVTTSTPLLLISGALVGYGTQLGSGCTSGHGVCGLSRFSKRSLVATLTFMGTGALAAYLTRVFSQSPSVLSSSFWGSLANTVVRTVVPVTNSTFPEVKAPVFMALASFASMVAAAHLSKVFKSQTLTSVAAALPGFTFAIGIGLSGMTDPNKVLNFLDFSGGNWDPSLAVVMASALLVNTLIYRVSLRLNKPVHKDCEFHTPVATDITPELVVGSAMFGVGWGIAGICPAPGIFRATETAFNFKKGLPMLSWVAALVFGVFVHQRAPLSFVRAQYKAISA